MNGKWIWLLLAAALLGGCFGSSPKEEEVQPDPPLQLIPAFGGMSFHQPVGLQHAGDGSGRLFVVEKPGRIVLLGDRSDQPARSVFLDIRDKVEDRGWEQGLLGLAFHPDFARNGYFYVNYTTASTTVLARYQTRQGNPSEADPGSGRILLEFDQPYGNHNGGELAFGPDGYLYIAVGDGGSGGDPRGHGQDRSTLLGSILRIDVDRTEGERLYGIPSDNPYAGNLEGFRGEIYAYGLRNPWRMSFDRQTGRLWAADVGQDRLEEINLIVGGGNYGWNTMEGASCFNPRSGCREEGLVLPVWEYAPMSGSRASVTGGHVYRGKDIPWLSGKYVFADYMDGRMWALQYEEEKQAEAVLLGISQDSITSFGVDQEGELYAVRYDGKILKLSTVIP